MGYNLTGMELSDFNYDLPKELIANYPPKVRGQSGLLVVDRYSQQIERRKYTDLIDYLNEGDCLVINDTKVIKARLLAQKTNGAERELLVLEQHGGGNWYRHQVLHRRKLSVGDELMVGGHKIAVRQVLDGGVAEIESKVNLLDLCEQFGEPPLPPYIKRRAAESDVKRYQTVFAQVPGSVAAPTASLNMTDQLLVKLRDKGVKIAYLTLHVGLGTFLPIRVDDLSNHQTHREFFKIPKSTIAEVYDAKNRGSRIVALGTTVARTLEYAYGDILSWGAKLADEPEHITNDILSGEADNFIYPGYQFKMVDALITNFHAPKSTVLMLAAAFAGWDLLMRAYDVAIDHQMRFLSYGDSMLIV